MSSDDHSPPVPPTYFALISTQRTGTNLLREIITTNPQTAMFAEILSPDPVPVCWHNYAATIAKTQTSAYPPLFPDQAEAQLDDYLTFLEAYAREQWHDVDRTLTCFGFDVKYNQLRFITPILWDLKCPAFLVYYLRQRQIRVIHLVRRNVIHTAVSGMVAIQRNTWHNFEGSKFTGTYRLDPEAVLEMARWIVNEQQVFLEMAHELRILEFVYEDLLEDMNQINENGKFGPKALQMRKLARFLNVPYNFRYTRSIHKVINQPYAEIIENHAELVAAVRSSEFAAFAETL